MSDNPELQAALDKLAAVAKGIHTGRSGKGRPLMAAIDDPGERLWRIEDGLLAIEEALRALKS